MKISATGIERLTKLADYMDGLNDPRFTTLFVRHDCGAPACAWGHARILFAAQMPKRMPLNVGSTEFFGLPSERDDDGFEPWMHLFGVNSHLETPQQWAAHCRAFLKEHGAQVTAPNKFTAFMGRVLAPVEVEA